MVTVSLIGWLIHCVLTHGRGGYVSVLDGSADLAATALVAEASADPFGHTSPSVYETARLVALAPPWLGGHPQRVRFLLATQESDGSWGGQDGYGLVPALSAIDALFTVLYGPSVPGIQHEKVSTAVHNGLSRLIDWLRPGVTQALPDTIAVEIIVPALIEEVNRHLDQLARQPVAGLERWAGEARLRTPEGADHELLTRLRQAVQEGHVLPEKLWHTLEALGPAIRGAEFVRPVNGSVACSPAATAAWLGDAPAPEMAESVRHLNEVQERFGGPVPVGVPVNIMECAWMVSTLVSSGLGVDVPDHLVRTLHAAFGESGASVGAGLTPDADDTATALYALALVDSPRSPDCLATYWEGTHFSTFPSERTPSTTTNAHAVQALGALTARGRAPVAPLDGAVGAVVSWLCARQEPDGSWQDKWHASPYYATLCCALALAEHGGDAARPAVAKAVRWVLDSQRENGSWGRWSGTYEETAYAVRLLLTAERHAGSTLSELDDGIVRAAARGYAFLLWSEGETGAPHLWHDKDLYTPIRMVRAEGLAARHLARSDPRIAALINGPSRTAETA
jgi:halimadienyl-diphosphate synthase